MTDAIKRCSTRETAACCCVDVGTILDNSDCTASYRQDFQHQDQAEAMLRNLTAKARAVESEPCLIDSQFHQTSAGIQLECHFTFSCQAETMIFQLGLR
ncbi:YfcZ/YiiS family protein [Erwinia piriflorinigrans]|uniref:UPF0381 protein n=1 Tax=Erwinia piriflorinigrans CFBP 5888 TaxID=1161919 RepID=V5Z9G1_9GAMM|nr:YfcZ/YiiS family protein [Erwinia piriflorinigrans]CCG87884.1 UPF0381 protein [Erwinia piriflorinigrans CFBP 5888]